MLTAKVLNNNIESAIKFLKRRKAEENDKYQEKLRRIPKPSERRKLKAMLALKRKKRIIQREKLYANK
jgi:ribosomal protein S21